MAAIATGTAMALLFAFLTQTLAANQMATGLALTLFGIGLSGLVGKPFTGLPGVKLGALHVPGLSGLRWSGRCCSARTFWCMPPSPSPCWWPGCSPGPASGWSSAPSAPTTIRPTPWATMWPPCATAASPSAERARDCGSYLSLVYTPQWIENMTAGRGWIALALVVFATWTPNRVAVGAYLFGGRMDHGPLRPGYRRDRSVPVPGVAAVPGHHRRAAGHLGNRILTKVNTPACIGQTFVPDR